MKQSDFDGLALSLINALEGINSKLERIADTLESNMGYEQTVKFDVETHNMLAASLGHINDAVVALKEKKNG
jgi:hypothetical protein